jgi:hypothetical protein
MAMKLPDGIAPIRFYLLADQPVMEVRLPDGATGIMALDPASGAFVLRHDLRVRLGEFWSTEIDRLEERDFAERVALFRFVRMVERMAADITWSRTGDGEFPYRAGFQGHVLTLRVNDFPAEPLYSVMCEGQDLGDLEDWPSTWIRPD